MNMKKILVLGGGLVGRHIATDLSDRYDVYCIDQDKTLRTFFANKKVTYLEGKVGEGDIAKLNRKYKFDYVVNALPGHLGYSALKEIIEERINCVDISFMPESAQSLHLSAKEKGVKIISDFGVAPGLCGLMAGKLAASTTDPHKLTIMVGGLPDAQTGYMRYKAPFSPIDVIEEYTRPARLVRDGQVVTMPAMSERELVKFAGGLELEAFNSDGLRSIISNLHIPNMVEKTLRYPGHIQLMENLRDMGFFKPENIPHTAEVLKKEWKLEPSDEEFTIMSVELTTKDGRSKLYHLFDRHDGKVPSMARTTGYTCNSGISIMENFRIDPGINFGEQLGKNQYIFSHVLEYLREREIKIIKL
jgi:saccharopine dehydrogenase-like NADP-dependent oxidoreductase